MSSAWNLQLCWMRRVVVVTTTSRLFSRLATLGICYIPLVVKLLPKFAASSGLAYTHID